MRAYRTVTNNSCSHIYAEHATNTTQLLPKQRNCNILNAFEGKIQNAGAGSHCPTRKTRAIKDYEIN
jgi:hypothetical protein